MTIQPITTMTTQSQSKIKPSHVKITGYAGAGFAVASAIAGSNKKIKLHKNLAYLAAIFTAAHIGLVEWFHHKK